MGDVLVRKARIQPQFSQGGFQFPIEVGGKRGGKNITFTNPTGLERTPRAAATAKEEGIKARSELARLPRTASLPVDEREKNRTERATMQGLIEDAGPRSLEEKIGVKSFNRLKDYEKYNPSLRDRAAARAGRVGVRGAKLGRGISSGLGLGLGILSGAAALSDSSAAGQDFGGALAGAGLTGVSTGIGVMERTDPLLQGLGARVGGRLGSASVTVPHRAMNRMDNQPTTLARGIENIRNRVTKPVAVTPTVAQPTTPTTPTDRNFLAGKSIFIGGAGQGRQERYPNTQLTPDQLRARLDNINTSAQFNIGLTPNQQMEKTHLERKLNQNTAAQPFNPQVQPDAMSMFDFTHPGGQQTITGQTPPVPTSIFAQPAEPTNPVAVQSNLSVNQAAEELQPKNPGTPEGSLMDKEPGAAGKQEGLAFLGQGAPQSMAGQSMAGNQQKLLEEEEEEQ